MVRKQRPDVFITHPRRARLRTGERLAPEFELALRKALGVNVFYDERDHLRGGESFDEQLKDVIARSRVCVVILEQGWTEDLQGSTAASSGSALRRL
jgi:hypothetical protein